MSELRQRLIEAMVLRGFAPRTQEIYVGAIWRMAKHYRRDPALYTQQEVQAYLLRHLDLMRYRGLADLDDTELERLQLAAEPTTDVGSDHPDLGLGDPEDCGQQEAQHLG